MDHKYVIGVKFDIYNQMLSFEQTITQSDI